MIKKINIEIEENSNIATVTIPTETCSKSKYIKLDNLVKILLDSKYKFTENILNKKDNNEIKINFDTGVLPACNGVSILQMMELSDKNRVVVLKKEACRHDFIYHKNVFKNVGIPTLIFVLKINENNIIYRGYLYSTKTNIINENTQMYCYPFTNTGSNGVICFGANQEYLKFNNINELFSFPDKFLMMPSTHELVYKNSLNLSVRDFLVSLENKDFDNEILIDYGKNYKQTINYII